MSERDEGVKPRIKLIRSTIDPETWNVVTTQKVGKKNRDTVWAVVFEDFLFAIGIADTAGANEIVLEVGEVKDDA